MKEISVTLCLRGETSKFLQWTLSCKHGGFPPFQRRGIGSALLEHAEKKACLLGLEKCSLIVHIENPAAQRLYERFGYRVVFSKTYPGAARGAYRLSSHGQGFDLICPGFFPGT